MVNLVSMVPGAYNEIKQDMLVAGVQGYAKNGFSGRVQFTHRGQTFVWDPKELHHAEPPKPTADCLAAIEQHRGAFTVWLSLPQTVLLVRFNRGEITKVQTWDEGSDEPGD